MHKVAHTPRYHASGRLASPIAAANRRLDFSFKDKSAYARATSLTGKPEPRIRSSRG